MRTQLVPRFNKPLFSLVPMDRSQHWANVSNAVEVSHNGRDSVAYIEVSATLFPILADLKVPLDSEVVLFLEDDGPRMLFGIIVDGEQLHDLWHYTMDKVPASLLHCR